MDFIGSLKPIMNRNDADRRRESRKTFKIAAILATTDAGMIKGQTIDISAHGLSFMSPIPLQRGTQCAIRFQVMIGGTKLGVVGAGKISNCTCSGMAGFRVGLKFRIKDAEVHKTLHDYLGLNASEEVASEVVTADTSLPASQ